MGDSTSTVAAARVSAGAEAVGGVAGAYATLQAGRYNARIDEYNARVADLQAKDAIRRGKEAVQDHRLQVRMLKGSQRAALAAQGVVVDQDVSADILDDTTRAAAEDERRIKLDANLEAWGFRVQATDYRARASLDRFSSRNEAVGQIMSTVGRFSESTYRARVAKEG